MTRHATFSDLPNELSVPIIISIAHRWVPNDKTSLSRLSRTSRAIHALVRPILFHTVTITERNITNIRVVPHAFHSTRHLIVKPLSGPAMDIFSSCTRSFPGVEAFSGPMAALQLVVLHSDPRRIVATDSVQLDRIPDYIGLERFSRITHLHMANQDSEPIQNGVPGGAWASLNIAHILLDINGPHVPIVPMFKYATLVTQLLTGPILPRLERLCVRFTEAGGTRIFQNYLMKRPRGLRRETRLWIAVGNGEWDNLSPLDDEYWMGGEQARLHRDLSQASHRRMRRSKEIDDIPDFEPGLRLLHSENKLSKSWRSDVDTRQHGVVGDIEADKSQAVQTERNGRSLDFRREVTYMLKFDSEIDERGHGGERLEEFNKVDIRDVERVTVHFLDVHGRDGASAYRKDRKEGALYVAMLQKTGTGQDVQLGRSITRCSECCGGALFREGVHQVTKTDQNCSQGLVL
ncbi:hypothetical protein EXIGLDRAFT_695373 [Exidia glandulosa HHB12029]|uniref:Uncharacterized protein n=1 Tax=Exidia glandulosa HHB12029 TaxID=1314781 RepID=A0A165FY60_EXIGL|nr:hypothetical protein EXIGLDRAFT_695373 [Exidia glandulosa HHB12029]